MAEGFSRTLESLKAEGSCRRGLLLSVAGLLLPWLGWFVSGRVTVYEVSVQGQLEVAGCVHPLASPVAGRVQKSRLALGRQVQAGEVVVVLETERERRALAGSRAAIQALASRRTALKKQIGLEKQTLLVKKASRQAALKEQQALVAQGQTRAQLALEKARVADLLNRRRAVARMEFLEAKTEAEAALAQARALALGLGRLDLDRQAEEAERRSRLALLERQLTELEGDIKVEEARNRRLEYELECRTIRATVAGVIAEVVERRIGAFVQAGDKFGIIVPARQPRVVGLFPRAAVGRIKPGQPARLRLDGFPWTRFGSLSATVADAGRETSNGLVQVELTLADAAAFPVTVEHGLTGSIQVAVEEVSPAELVLRAVGKFLQKR